MKNQSISLKPIPVNCSKSYIYRMYINLSDAIVREAMHFAIKKVNEENNVKYSKFSKNLSSKHIAIIIDELGDAPGYQPSEKYLKKYLNI